MITPTTTPPPKPHPTPTPSPTPPTWIPLTKNQFRRNRSYGVTSSWKSVNLPRIPSHTTVFTFSSVVFIRREETLSSLASTMYLLCQNWFGEHPRTTSCCLPIPIEIANTSLHTFRSDNMVCTISMKALAQFFSVGFKSQWHGSQPGRQGELSKKPGKSGWYRYICPLHLDIFLMNSNLQTGQICHIWLHTYSSLLLD